MPVLTNLDDAGMSDRHYSGLAGQYMPQTIRNYLRTLARHTEYDEDGLPVLPPEETRGLSEQELQSLRDHLTPEEQMLLRDNRDEALAHAIEDRLVLRTRTDPEALNNFIRLREPNYLPLSDGEMRARERISNEFRKKFAIYAAEREIVYQLTPITASNKRTAMCLFKVGITDEDLEWNKQLADDLASDDTAVKKAAFARALIRIADDTDMAALDLTSDTYIYENFEKYYSLISSGPELAALIGEYRDLGGEPDPELEKRMAKLSAIHEVSSVMRAKVDVLASPVYSMVRTEDLYGNANCQDMVLFIKKEAPDEDGEELQEIDPEEYLYHGNNADRPFVANLQQIFTANTLGATSHFYDRLKTPEQRLEDFYEDYRVREEEKRRQAEEREEHERERMAEKNAARNADIVRYVNLDRIPEGLTEEQHDKRIDYEIQLRKNIELLKDAITANNERCRSEYEAAVQAVMDEFMDNTSRADETLSGELREITLRTLTEEKDEKIRALKEERDSKLANELELTEEQIQSYLTPERMALLERAAAIRQAQEERKNIADRIADKPENLSRIVFAHLKNANEAGAEAHNRELGELVGGSDYNAQNGRKQMILDDVNTIVSLDADKLSFEKSFAEAADYALNNMDICMIGYDLQRIHQNMKTELGFSEKDELKGYMKDVVDKGVVLGGRGQIFTNLLLDDSYMKLPFENLDTRQMELLVDDAKSKPKAYGLDGSAQVKRLDNYNIFRESIDHPEEHSYTEPAKDTHMSLSSFEDRLPDTAQLRQQLRAFENRLKETDHWYNRSTASPEYRQMREALHNLRGELRALTGIDGNAGRFQTARANLVTAVMAYANHVGAAPKNENQRLRFEAANELKSFVSTVLPGKTVSAVIKNNALAQPAGNMAYEINIEPQSVKTAPGAENVRMQSGAAGELYDMLDSAKRELSEALKAPSPDPDLIRHMAATVITCRMYEKKLGIAPPENNGNIVIGGGSGIDLSGIDPADAKNFLGNEVISLMKSEAFKSALPKLDKEKLQQLIMSEDAAKTEIMRDIYDGLSKQNKAPEAGGRSSGKSHSRQSDAPQKKGKALGK